MARTDAKRRARLDIILRHILGRMPCEELPHAKSRLPTRQERGDYVEPD